MAYYPVEETKVIYASTKEEMEAQLADAYAAGYFPVSDTDIWDARLPEKAVAYRQTLVKRTNTDPQFIADMFAAFQSTLEGINSQLASINSKLTTANGYLKTIAEK